MTKFLSIAAIFILLAPLPAKAQGITPKPKDILAMLAVNALKNPSQYQKGVGFLQKNHEYL